MSKIKSTRSNYVYDLETLSNCFIAVFTSVDGLTTHEFVMHESRDDNAALLEFCKDLITSGSGLIGFNNKHFDWPVLRSFIYEINKGGGDLIARRLYSVAQGIISTRRKTYVEENIPQLDLFLINHYDNKNKSTSLKALQVSIQWENVQDMPIHHSTEISETQIEEILVYCRNDVASTRKFYELNSDKIDLRKKLGYQMKMKFINKNDVSIGESTFIKYLAKEMGIKVSDVRNIKGRKSDVPMKDICFDYIKFRTPEFQSLHNKFLTNTMGKSVYDELSERLEKRAGNDIEDYLNVLNSLNLKSRQEPESKKKSSFSFHQMYDGLMYDYGIGGIHACVPPGIYTSDNRHIIVDLDVKSYYPNLAIRNGLHPKQFPKEVFCRTYEMIFNKRVEAQLVGDKVMSDGLKLALNGVFGKSLDQYSSFFDPWFFAGITVNGQLLLTMLAEDILLDIAGSKVIQVNTDGVTVRIPRASLPVLDRIRSDWEAKTKLVLESNEYDKMCIRDVNNYLAVDTKGKIKEKGAFETVKEWHKDPSFLVIPYVVREYLIHGKPIMDTLRNHENLYDFCGRYKATPGFSANFVYLHEDKERVDNYGKIMRYLPVTRGGTSMKFHKDGRKINLLEGWPTQVANDIHTVSKENINYTFFEVECQKLIQSIIPLQTTLL